MTNFKNIIDEEKLPCYITYKELSKMLKSNKLYKQISKIKDKHLSNNFLLLLFYIEYITYFYMFTNNNEKSKSFILGFLFVNLSNSLYSYIHLLIDGLENQAAVLFRNILEQIPLILAISIDKDKWKKYLDMFKDENYTLEAIWRKEFTIKKLWNTVDKYFKIDENSELSFIIEKRKNHYSFYSDFVHIDLMRTVCYSFNNNDFKVYPNFLGNKPTSIKTELNSCIVWIYIFTLLFLKIVAKEKKSFDVNKENIDYINKGIYSMLIFKKFIEKDFSIFISN